MAEYLDVSYAGYTADQCLALTPPNAQVACSAQLLNVTDPPSIYSWDEYAFLWEGVTCMLSNVTYTNRVDIPDNFNWCTVPLKGSDAFLFASLALIFAGCLFGKLAVVWVLIAGGALGAVNNYANLLQVSNSISIWLGISPPDLFFYAFIPPLAVDSAIRLDFFLFSKLWMHVLLLAFVMVILSAAVLTPFILFVLGFASRGFTWVHGALFAAMIASTDALAATAILKAGGGPDKLVALMEAEALLNDASAITLFEVFLKILMDHPGDTPMPSVWSAIPGVITDTLRLAAIGAGVGLGMSIATGYLLRWLRWRGARASIEFTIVLAVSYLSFYVANSPAMGSGVIAVVVFGLWGNYTSKWGMLASTEDSGAFDAFWETLSFASNGLVFFWTGIASVNFFIRSVNILGGNAWSYGAVPLIFIFMLFVRTGCLALFNISVFAWIRERLGWTEVVFTGWCGLRGSVSLIMIADFISNTALLQGDTTNPDDPSRERDRVNSDISVWTASFVLLTLVINAPSIGLMLRWLKLDRITPEKQAMRAKAKRALMRFTGAAIGSLREDDEQFLQGANWQAVGRYVDVSDELKKFDPPLPPAQASAISSAASPGSKQRLPGGETDAKGGKATLSRKSVGQSVSEALRVPLSPFMSTQRDGDTSDGGAETDASRRSGGRFRNVFRPSTAHAQLGQTSEETRERAGRSRQRRQRDAAGRPFTSGAGFDSDKESSSSDAGESDSSGYRSNASSNAGGGKAGAPAGTISHGAALHALFDDSDSDALEGLVEECPFIQAKQPRLATQQPPSSMAEQQEQVPTADARASKGSDIEMGLHPTAAAVEASAGAAAEAGAAAATGVLATAKAPVAAAGGLTGQQAPPAGGSSAGWAPAGAPAPASPAAADGDQEQSAEGLAFIRQWQQSQRQRRPALGSIFGAAESDATNAGLQRGGGGSADDLYYSSMPATAGRQMALQLQQELQAGINRPPAAEGPAAVTEPRVSLAGGTSAAAAGVPASEDQTFGYYSSVPAAVGRQMALQLKQEQLKQEQLKQEQLKQQEDQQAPPSAAAAATGSLQEATGQPGAGGGIEEAAADYYSSLPAAAGRTLQLQLQQQLATAKQQPTLPAEIEADSITIEPSKQPAAAPAAGRHVSARRLARQASPAQQLQQKQQRGWEEYHRTVTGAAGPSLAAELQRQLAHNRAATAAAGADGASLRTSSGVPGGLTRRSVDMPAARDTSWQHKPVRAARVLTRTSPGLTSINSMPPAVPADSEGIASGDPFGGPAAGVAPLSLPQAHSSAAPSSAGGGAKGVRVQAALARFSMAGSAGSPMHGASAYETAASVPTGSGNHFSAGVLREMRSRLIAGLKRYYHAKRLEGLLSVQGLRILEYACDYAAEHTVQPLSVWKLLEREVAGNQTTRIMARCLVLLARGWRSSPRWLQAVTSWPVKKVSGFLRRLLGQRMLVSCEVAVEYYLSMVHSPQIQWLQQADEAWPLQQEVEAEVDAAYKFIIDREIEAPDRFQAIQSYRAAMAVLRQQLTFVHELYESGMVDEGEKDDIEAPLDKRMRHLEITGPVWKPPRPRAVLRSLPFMQPLPEEMFRVILRAGSIKEQKMGVAFWSSSNLPAVSGLESGPGVYVVLSGVIRRLHQHLDGTVKEYFQGTGGVVGSLLALTGTRLPGNETAVAEGNTLGKGPTLFHVPQSAVFEVLQRKAAGSKPAAMLHLQLLRGAAAYVCESCESDVVHALHLHLLQLAVARMLRSRKGRPSRHINSLASRGAPTTASMPCVSTDPVLGQQQQQQQQRNALFCLQQKSVSGEFDLALRRHSALARGSSWQFQQQRKMGAASMLTQREEEELLPLHRQTSVGPGVRGIKGFGGHMADVMQQIAAQEFEQLEAREQHMGKVDESDEDDGSLASPNPSGSTGAGLGRSGNSSNDLQTTAAADGTTSGVFHPPLPARNGHAAAHDSQQFGVPEQAYSDTASVAAMKAASKSMRQSARAAERSAPQYAVEVLAEFRRGVTSGVLLRLPAGLAFRQTTHAVLLRGQLLAVGPPLAADDISPASSAQHPKEQLSNSRLDEAFSGGNGSKSPHRSSSTREVDWEAGLAKMAAAAACPAAPQLLPWLCNPRYRCNSGARLPAEQLWQAGRGGAQLLVCLTDAGEVPDGVEEAEASAAADAAPAAAAPDVELGRPSVEAHPLDLPSASSSQRGQGVEGAMRAAGESAVRSATQVASIAAAPAAAVPSGLRSLMPWQHRYSRGSTARTGSEAGAGALGTDTSIGAAGNGSDGSGSGAGSNAAQLADLRLPLDRLAGRRNNSSGRSFNGFAS
ncbi:hypothetical protein D9Q98_009830 [Chlorella vulgaris]|uniref:Uncharacterized protein n=1 Tax=Chlorella vulgaris TaxID=3077 RepID=A0A9D4YSL6_CHLVU|nr:hypothetical protein D9Q98_009830 [Chlorella vulgaris]